MIRKRKNPYHEDLAKSILDKSDGYEFLAEGAMGEVYYFIIDREVEIYNILLKKGEYVLKINWGFSNNIEKFKKLSNLKLIPEIYYIDKNIIIMKYIEGVTLRNISKNRNKYKNSFLETVMFNIIEENNKWDKFEMVHGDVHPGNILIDKKANVIFIDPYNYDDYVFDLRNLDLSELDLSFIDLSNTRMINCNFSKTKLYKSNFSTSSLSDSNLQHAYLFGANLNNATLDRSDLTEANLEQSKLRNSSLVETNFYKANLKEADLREAYLYITNLQYANLFGANISGVSFKKTKLYGTNFEYCIMDHLTDFSEAFLLQYAKNLTLPKQNPRSYAKKKITKKSTKSTKSR